MKIFIGGVAVADILLPFLSNHSFSVDIFDQNATFVRGVEPMDVFSHITQTFKGTFGSKVHFLLK